MKRFFLLAIMALLIGGFTSNANAQIVKKSSKSAKKETVQAKKTTLKDASKETNWNTVIKDYEYAVEKAVKMYKSMSPKVDPKEFNQCLDRALDLKAQLTKAKDKLNRTQIRRFDKATEKLNQILTKD